MPDEKPPMPPQPTTKELPRVTVPGSTLDALLSEVREMRLEHRASNQELSDKVDTLSLNVDALQHDAKDTRLRIGRMEREIDEVKDRQSNVSERVRQPSSHDLETAKALADEIAARTALATKVDDIATATTAQTEILNRLEKGAAKLAANPIVRSIAVMLGTAALTWLAAHGGVK